MTTATAEEPVDRTEPEGPATLWNSAGLAWGILAFGALLRLTQYLANRSLWLDEAMLALNIVNRSFRELLKPLDYAQGAPVGFLMLERAAVQALGPGEYALRLFPFVCGMASLFLFYRLAKQVISANAVPVALGLFASSAPLIYYASEAKQYSSDAAIAMLLSSTAVSYASAKSTLGRSAAFGLLGGAAVWFSHPSVFVLAGIGMSLALCCPAEERWSRIRNLVIPCTMWAVSLGTCYLLFLRHLSNNRFLLRYWTFGFPPPHLLSVATVEWFASTFFEVFKNPGGLELAGVAAFAFLVGCAAMFSSRRQTLFILIAPLFVTLLAAMLHQYPFNGRLLLFGVPALLLLVAEGVEQIRSRTWREAPVIAACLMGVLFFNPLLFASYHLVKPSLREEIKPALHHVEANSREGDVLYVQNGAVPAFRYYKPRLHMGNVAVTEGSYVEDHWEKYERDMDQFRGHRRVWLLFSQGSSETGVEQQKMFLYFADKRGTRLDYFQSVGAAAYLYDFGRPSDFGMAVGTPSIPAIQ
jgi:hypothetical protein